MKRKGDGVGGDFFGGGGGGWQEQKEIKYLSLVWMFEWKIIECNLIWELNGMEWK